MVDNIRNGFIGRSSAARQEERNLKEAQKAIREVNDRFNKTTGVLQSALKGTIDSKTRKQLQELVQQAEEVKQIQNSLKVKGKTISSKEAKTFLTVIRNVNSAVQESKDLQKSLKLNSEQVKDLDINKPLNEATKKIGTNASRFFVDNAQKISSSGLAQDAAGTGLAAISPEAAAIAGGLGVNLSDSLSSILSGDEQPIEEKQVGAIESLEDSVKSMADELEGQEEETRKQDKDLVEKSEKSETRRSTDRRKRIVDAIKEASAEEVRALEAISKGEEFTATQVQASIMSQKEIASNKEEQELAKMEVEAKRHEELIEKVDDVVDATDKSPGILSRLLGRLRLPGAAGASAGGIGSLASRFKGPAGLLRGGAIGLGALAGFDALGDIRNEGLTTGNLLQSAGSGALIGSAFGPLGAVIGGGVGALAAAVTASLSDEDVEKIKSGFKKISDFFIGVVKTNIERIGPVIATVVDGIGNFISDPIGTIDRAFDSLGNWVDSTASEVKESVAAVFSTAREKFDSVISSISGFFMGIGPSIIEFFAGIPNLIKEKLDFGDGSPLMDSVNSILDFFLIPIRAWKKGIEGIKSFVLGEDSGSSSLVSGGVVTVEEPSIAGFIADSFRRTFGRDSSPVSNPVPVRASIPVSLSDSASQLQSEISQASSTGALLGASALQTKEIQKQQKETVKFLSKAQEEQRQKEASSYTGKSSLDNTPVMTSDIGLIYTLGGGM